MPISSADIPRELSVRQGAWWMEFHLTCALLKLCYQRLGDWGEFWVQMPPALREYQIFLDGCGGLSSSVSSLCFPKIEQLCGKISC